MNVRVAAQQSETTAYSPHVEVDRRAGAKNQVIYTSSIYPNYESNI